MKHAIVLLADGFELVEAMTVVDYLRRAEVRVTTAATAAIDVRSQSDVLVRADELFDEEMELPDAVIIPGGGTGAKNLREDRRVTAFIRRMDQAKHLIAAICAGPTVLEAAGILQGRTGTSYPGFENELSYAAYTDRLAHTDGHIITSRGPATTIFFAGEIVSALTSKNTWQKLSREILQDLVLAKKQ